MHTAKLTFLVITVATILGNGLAKDLGCLDHVGNPVDWYVALRLPGKSPRKMVVHYPGATTWVNLLQNDGAGGEGLLKTLFQQLDHKKTKSAAFNDEPPAKPSKVDFRNHMTAHEKAHAKGVIAVDQNDATKGFFLHHSVPKYPVYDPSVSGSPYSYITRTTSHYGQHFMCMTIKTDALLQTLLKSFTLANVHFYHNDFPASEFEEAVKLDTQILTKPKFLQSSLKDNWSKNEHQLAYNWVSLTKSGQETTYLLWDDYVAPYFKSSFIVETWGRPLEAPICNDRPYKVSNCKYVKQFGLEWKETKDHSKWGVDVSGDWLCLGDMNRMTTQAKRGGSVFCYQDKHLRDNFWAMVETDDCGLKKADDPVKEQVQ